MWSEEQIRKQAIELCDVAQASHRVGDLERAVELYARSLATYPTAEAFTFLGWAYSMLGRPEEAIAECQKAIATDPSFGNPYNDIGAYLITLGRTEEAIGWLERAKRAERYVPRHFPYMNLARIYARRGELRRAAEELEGGLSVQPDDPYCRAALRELLDRLN